MEDRKTGRHTQRLIVLSGTAIVLTVTLLGIQQVFLRSDALADELKNSRLEDVEERTDDLKLEAKQSAPGVPATTEERSVTTDTPNSVELSHVPAVANASQWSDDPERPGWERRIRPVTKSVYETRSTPSGPVQSVRQIPSVTIEIRPKSNPSAISTIVDGKVIPSSQTSLPPHLPQQPAIVRLGPSVPVPWRDDPNRPEFQTRTLDYTFPRTVTSTDANGRSFTQTIYEQRSRTETRLKRSKEELAIIDQLESELSQFRSADDNTKSALREKIQELTSKHFDLLHKRRDEEIQQLEQRLEKVQSVQKQRSDNREQIIEAQVNRLLGQPDPLAWDPDSTPLSRGPQTNARQTPVAPAPAGSVPGVNPVPGTPGWQQRYYYSPVPPQGSTQLIPNYQSGTALTVPFVPDSEQLQSPRPIPDSDSRHADSYDFRELPPPSRHPSTFPVPQPALQPQAPLTNSEQTILELLGKVQANELKLKELETLTDRAAAPNSELTRLQSEQKTLEAQLDLAQRRLEMEVEQTVTDLNNYSLGNKDVHKAHNARLRLKYLQQAQEVIKEHQELKNKSDRKTLSNSSEESRH